MAKIYSAATIGRGAIWSLLNQFASQLLVLAVFLVTARFVSKEDFGVMAFCYLIVEFFRQVLIESMGNTLTSRAKLENEDYSAGFAIVIGGSVLSAAVVFLLAYPLSVFFKNPEIEYGLQLTCLILLTMGLSKIHEVWLIKHMNFRALALRSIFAVLVGGGAGIYLAMKGHGLTSLITQQILTSLLGMICLWAVTPWRPQLKINMEKVKFYLRFNRFVSLSAVPAFIGSQSDVLFSSYYLGAASTGVYNASKRILVAMNVMFVSGLNSVAYPAIASKTDQAALGDIYVKSVLYTIALTAPAYIGLAAVSEDVVAFILGEKWMATAPIISILAIGGLLSSIDLYNNNIRIIRDKPHYQVIVNSINAAANIAVLFAMARHGLSSLAIALIVRNLACYPISFFNAMQLIKIDYPRLVFGAGKVLLSAFAMGVIVSYAQNYMDAFPPLVRLIILVPSGALLYAFFQFAINRTLFNELMDVAKHVIKGHTKDGKAS